ncbi:hypothetical protein HPB51_000417 [Rhipicephalus microplus]|uniref:Zinc finger PHD-type domain-containing protein n=1 Tax=Rhipicephalus microplus TaxID=6941 RepID=A0A9J6D3M3_RHIMP|nr:hypothetical protein HPB51_000417 [Rhipicephalus microplus]
MPGQRTMTSTCQSCDEPLPCDGRVLKCNECESSYHVGSCSGWSETTFKTKGESGRRAWRCAACRSSKAKSGEKTSVDSELTICLADITRRLDTLAGLPAQVGEIKVSIQLLSQKYDDILNCQAKQEKDISSLNRRVGKLEADCTSSDIQQLKATVNDLEFRSRRLNIEVHGIRVTPDENLLCKLNDVAKIANLPELTGNDIAAIHRLPAKPNKTPGIIVRFAQQSIRDKWLGRRKALRDASNVSITENMTQQNRELLRNAKDWAQNNGYRFSWHCNGKILVRKREGDSAVVIRRLGDLDKL